MVQLDHPGKKRRADQAAEGEINSDLPERTGVLRRNALSPVLVQAAKIEFLADRNGQTVARNAGDIVCPYRLCVCHDNSIPQHSGHTKSNRSMVNTTLPVGRGLMFRVADMLIAVIDF